MAESTGLWDSFTTGLSTLMNGSGTNDARMLALTGFGLASLADNLNRTPDPIKSPTYNPAPVYNRALTAPMRDVNSFGSKLYFNPQPFSFDPATAGTQYGPSQTEIDNAANAYRTGVASMYDNMPTKQLGAANTPGKKFAANMQTAQGRAPTMMEMVQASQRPTERIELRPYGLGGLGITGTLPAGGGTTPGGTTPGGTTTPAAITMNPIQTSLYFAYNPDVKAGYDQYKDTMTPEAYASLHYNTWGKNENRGLPPTTLDTAAAEWYYDQYPDVANAYSTYYSNMSPEEIATQHYNRYGRNEQRLLPGMTEFFAAGGPVGASTMPSPLPYTAPTNSQLPPAGWGAMYQDVGYADDSPVGASTTPWTMPQAQQYMRNNPDVLTAYNANASTPAPAFAQSHYNQYGQAEQRMFPSMVQRAGTDSLGRALQTTNPGAVTNYVPPVNPTPGLQNFTQWNLNTGPRPTTPFTAFYSAGMTPAERFSVGAQTANKAYDAVVQGLLGDDFKYWSNPYNTVEDPRGSGYPTVYGYDYLTDKYGTSDMKEYVGNTYDIPTTPNWNSTSKDKAGLTAVDNYLTSLRAWAKANNVNVPGGTGVYKRHPQAKTFEEAAAIAAAQKAKDDAFNAQRAAQFMRHGMASRGLRERGEGGLGSLNRERRYAAGGPVAGPGDGMSDSIPTTINGRQPAALSDGEYVLPAHFVSALGNGSTRAGVQQIQSMVDRVMAAKYRTRDATPRPLNPRAVMPV